MSRGVTYSQIVYTLRIFYKITLPNKKQKLRAVDLFRDIWRKNIQRVQKPFTPNIYILFLSIIWLLKHVRFC